MAFVGGQDPDIEWAFSTEEIAVEFCSMSQFLAEDRASKVGCIIFDVCSCPGFDLSVLVQVSRLGQSLPVILCVDSSDVRLAVRALKAGAIDVLERPVDGGRLLASVKEALGSHQSVAPSLRSFAPKIGPDRARAALASLTPRQGEILDRILQGHPNKNIAADLGISQRTAENHRAVIMKKMGVTSISALVQVALAAS